jgi:hypothetical protein
MSEQVGRGARGMVPVVVFGVAVPAPGDTDAILTASLAWLLVPLIVLALGAAAFMAYRRLAHRTDQADPDDDLPPLVFPVTARTFVAAASPTHPAGKTAQRQSAQAAPSASPPPAGAAAQDAASIESGAKGEHQGGHGERTRKHREAAPPRRNGRASAETGPSGTDTTLQLLPGRLEVIGGEVGAGEIRFVRPAGGDPVVTLGRAAGEPPGHVRLHNPTVSRTHARLRFEKGEWHVVNLSSTNPALLNGEVLPVDDAERALQDGDRLELGEVVLRYRRR